MAGNVFIISGVSGSGKSTIADLITKRHPTVMRSVTVTTRTPREGELYGSHYFFADQTIFQWLIDTEQILEYNKYDKHFYGTLKLSLEQILAHGQDALFVVDTNGTERIMGFYPQARAVFLRPPSDEEQKNRLKNRGMQGSYLQDRVDLAHQELTHAEALGLPIVVNDELEAAYQEVCKILGL